MIRGGEAEPAFITMLAGPGQERFLDEPEEQRYWLRVWGVRGLLWALTAPGAPSADDPVVTAAVVGALGDGHWRVREMALKLVARHCLDAAQPALIPLLTDDTLRVRVAASRALRLLTVA